MSEVFNPAPAATMLATAWHNGTRLSELPAEIRPRTLDEGYDVQDRFVAELGEPVIGWKLGVGSPNFKRQSAVGRSIAGRILRRHSYRSGDTVPLPNAAPVTVEFEIAYTLGREITPGLAIKNPLDAVASSRAAFELVLSRFVDRRAVGWPSFAADNAAFQALILGEEIEPDRVDELASSLVVIANGREAARCVSGDDATDPAGALADLLAIAGERNIPLPQGTIVATGAVSKPFTIADGPNQVVARFLEQELRFQTQVGT